MGVDPAGRDLAPLIDAVKTRSRTILDVAERVAVRLDPSRAALDAKSETLIRKMGPAFAANLRRVALALDALGPAEWSADRILEALKLAAETHALKLGDAMQPVRVALTGSTVSEPVNELLAVVDRTTALRRLREVARQWDQGDSPAA
jgi:glutamyl-tRNA synthetase